MNIADAKKQVKETVTAYLTKDQAGMYRIPPAQQRPIFLVGAPGIGKTSIMSQVANELGIGLVSYSMTHHTRQSALGLPFIVKRDFGDESFDVSEYTMSEIIASIYDYMQKTGLEQGILFIDEINCVSETLYPSMLQFLQFKTFGTHKVPKDWVVVCAGNPPEYNRSVHEFDIVTLDRLRKIDVHPDFEAWKPYARSVKVHPAIMSFLEIRHQDFYFVETTPSGKSFATARGWNDLSETITLFEELGYGIDRDLVAQYLQCDEIADRFIRYYELFDKYRSDYQVDSILAGQASEAIKQRARDAKFDERLALLSLIVDSLEHDMAIPQDQGTLVLALRDVLRECKPAIVGGAAAQDELERPIAGLAAHAREAEAMGTAPDDQIRFELMTSAKLQELLAACTAAGASRGQEAFDAIEAAYGREVNAIQPAADRAEARLDNAFAFIDEVWGDGKENMVFVVELTERVSTSGFISEFGSESYYAHSAALLVDGADDQIRRKISELDELGLEAAHVDA